LLILDLRDDKQFFMDHPGAVPITTAQVYAFIFSACDYNFWVTIYHLSFLCYCLYLVLMIMPSTYLVYIFSFSFLITLPEGGGFGTKA